MSLLSIIYPCQFSIPILDFLEHFKFSKPRTLAVMQITSLNQSSSAMLTINLARLKMYRNIWSEENNHAVEWESRGNSRPGIELPECHAEHFDPEQELRICA